MKEKDVIGIGISTIILESTLHTLGTSHIEAHHIWTHITYLMGSSQLEEHQLNILLVLRDIKLKKEDSITLDNDLTLK